MKIQAVHLSDLEENTIESKHRYSGKQGKWGYWVIQDRNIIEYLGEENYYPCLDMEERLKNFAVLGKAKHLLKETWKKKLKK